MPGAVPWTEIAEGYSVEVYMRQLKVVRLKTRCITAMTWFPQYAVDRHAMTKKDSSQKVWFSQDSLFFFVFFMG